MGGYERLSVLLKEEVTQLVEEGFEVDCEYFNNYIAKAGNDRVELMEIYEKMLTLVKRSGYPYEEPSEYDRIVAESAGGSPRIPLPADNEKLYGSFYGAWLGRCIGCALGQPIELWDYKAIRKWFEGANSWPIEGYVPAHSAMEQEGKKITIPGSTADHIKHMVTDDDIRYTVLAIKLVEEKGFDFDAYDVGSHWAKNLPYDYVCTAEKQAYQNFVNVDSFGPWGRPDKANETLKECKVNTYLNPYREWIGAQIRIDGYGYAAAGDPHKAAYLAYQDASFSHVKNGIYGAMFFAAMIASAFGEKDVERLYKISIKEVPRRSRFYEAMEKAYAIGSASGTQQELIERINAEFAEYHPVHTINNAAICLASIIFSKGDFNTAVTTAVASGLDTDCNGATVGSVMGALVGEPNIPEKWKAPLNDLLYSSIPDYHPIAISELARKTMDLYLRLQ